MKGKSVLIVDDEAIVRDSIRDWLVNAGYEVATAESAEEALQQVAKKDFSVMVLDIRLPGQTGLSVLRQVKAERPWIKSIIITAYPSEETTAEASRLGAIDYLVKPLAPDDLEKLIHDSIVSAGAEATVAGKPAKAKAPAAPAKRYAVMSKGGFKAFVENLMKSMPVYGVKVKQTKFAFDQIQDVNDLVMDYDVTIMPPTKFLFPAREQILKFNVGDGAKVTPVTDTSARAIVGVHPCDINAIGLLDEVFIATNPDPNYIARRQNSIIIGVDDLNPSSKAFSPSMGTHVAEGGFDLMLTDIGNRYLVQIGSNKGAELLAKNTQTSEPTAEDIAKQRAVHEAAQMKYQLHLEVPRDRLPKLLEDYYDDPYWAERASTCFSCGSCVMVCPTCFCFDVQDDMALNLKEGTRTRQWDGCMLVDFAKVATGENFRHDKTSRFHHRMFRKGKYVVERFGKVGCVGCGRCVGACLVDIASPVAAFNSIAAKAQAKQTARLSSSAVAEKDLYAPRQAKIIKIEQLAAKEKAFQVKFQDGKDLNQVPGQFVEVSTYGIGEAPFGVTTSQTRPGSFGFAVRNVGGVTNALHNLKEGDTIGVRGPFGTGFNTKSMEGKDILFIAGGIGLFPVRSLIEYVLDKRSDFGRAIVCFGARSPAERLFINELEAWKKNPAMEFYETVDRGSPEWKGNVGVITTLIPKIQLDPKKTVAVVVGPPIMYRFVIVELKKKDLADDNIILSLERRMKCGVGKCGHCQINGVYVCQEGPVFSLAQLRNLREAV
ncbi:MAG TPA: 4Fe-4S dicluster domain-containing protein [Dehalococcoidales bacterium]|nr:4Fe-4S dicluster domain-containing protein [Dehalococcoidales bacterium]